MPNTTRHLFQTEPGCNFIVLSSDQSFIKLSKFKSVRKMLRCIVAFLAIAGSSMGFAPPGLTLRSSGTAPTLRRPAVCGVHMGKTAADGLFTPLVNAVKYVLGDKTLNKIRGDVISKHSAVSHRHPPPQHIIPVESEHMADDDSRK